MIELCPQCKIRQLLTTHSCLLLLSNIRIQTSQIGWCAIFDKNTIPYADRVKRLRYKACNNVVQARYSQLLAITILQTAI